MMTIGILSVPLTAWVIAYMITRDSGPFEVFETLRYKLGADELQCQYSNANILCCWRCLSVWITPLVYLLWKQEPEIVLVGGLIGLCWIVGFIAQRLANG